MFVQGRTSSLLLLACLCSTSLQAYADEPAPVAAVAVADAATVQAPSAAQAPGTSGAAPAPVVPAEAALRQDVDRLVAIFDTQDADSVDEALVQLRWAGITDLRLHEHLLGAVLDGKLQRASMRERYIEALGYAGNPAVYARLRELLTNPRLTRGDRDAVQEALALESRYTEIAAVMAVDMAQVTDVATLWAQRHQRGLRVGDGVRVRWAARDLYLHRYGRPSLDVAAEFLRSRMAFTLEDDNVEDAMAFLCKALGLSGVEAYKPLLVEVSNASPSEKVADYAERAVQYFDPAFERTKRRFDVPVGD